MAVQAPVRKRITPVLVSPIEQAPGTQGAAPAAAAPVWRIPPAVAPDDPNNAVSALGPGRRIYVDLSEKANGPLVDLRALLKKRGVSAKQQHEAAKAAAKEAAAPSPAGGLPGQSKRTPHNPLHDIIQKLTRTYQAAEGSEDDSSGSGGSEDESGSGSGGGSGSEDGSAEEDGEGSGDSSSSGDDSDSDAAEPPAAGGAAAAAADAPAGAAGGDAAAAGAAGGGGDGKGAKKRKKAGGEYLREGFVAYDDDFIDDSEIDHYKGSERAKAAHTGFFVSTGKIDQAGAGGEGGGAPTPAAEAAAAPAPAAAPPSAPAADGRPPAQPKRPPGAPRTKKDVAGKAAAAGPGGGGAAAGSAAGGKPEKRKRAAGDKEGGGGAAGEGEGAVKKKKRKVAEGDAKPGPQQEQQQQQPAKDQAPPPPAAPLGGGGSISNMALLAAKAAAAKRAAPPVPASPAAKPPAGAATAAPPAASPSPAPGPRGASAAPPPAGGGAARTASAEAGGAAADAVEFRPPPLEGVDAMPRELREALQALHAAVSGVPVDPSKAKGRSLPKPVMAALLTAAFAAHRCAASSERASLPDEVATAVVPLLTPFWKEGTIRRRVLDAGRQLEELAAGRDELLSAAADLGVAQGAAGDEDFQVAWPEAAQELLVKVWDDTTAAHPGGADDALGALKQDVVAAMGEATSAEEVVATYRKAKARMKKAAAEKRAAAAAAQAAAAGGGERGSQEQEQEQQQEAAAAPRAAAAAAAAAAAPPLSRAASGAAPSTQQQQQQQQQPAADDGAPSSPNATQAQGRGKLPGSAGANEPPSPRMAACMKAAGEAGVDASELREVWGQIRAGTIAQQILRVLCTAGARGLTARDIVAHGCRLDLGWADAPKQRQSITQALRSAGLRDAVAHVGDRRYALACIPGVVAVPVPASKKGGGGGGSAGGGGEGHEQAGGGGSDGEGDLEMGQA
ncbi:MAG: hypothetical protein J3K34DRAFT_526050 [Monoraphidium minutum]|nr:MAG: hypothetical protein J3K34DRAFT_526050 [Monoraphidium minutum]